MTSRALLTRSISPTRTFALWLIVSMIAPYSASAMDLCKAVALRPVTAIEDRTAIIPKGGYDTTITQFNVDDRTGDSVFCSHGGYCYPTHVRIGGRRVEVLRLTNCTVDFARGSRDGDRVSYPVDIVRAKISRGQLRRHDLDDKMRELGLCTACASNVVDFYTTQPGSRCARLTRRALEGDPVAMKTLQTFPDYCRLGPR